MIHLNSVSKSFNGHEVVRNLTLQIGPGEIYGLLGANGAGKSTTINMLLGFLRADSGTVQIKEIDVGSHPVKTRKHIGYIPENVNLYPYLSGVENLDYFCGLAKIKYDHSQLVEYLSTCGLQKDAHTKRVAQYSKGMRQKVAIAIAYAKKAEVYLLDEPASGLDPLASNDLSKLLENLAAEGATILMASHDIFRVREVCHRIGILKNGELLRELSSGDVNAKELETLYIKYMHG